MPRRRPPIPDLAALSGREVVAVAALLEHGSVAGAAAATGIPERTIRHWQSRPAFRAALRAERRTIMDGVTSRLASGASEAVDALLAVLRDKQAAPTARVSAARVLLESARGAVSDADVAARLERIESLAEGRAPAVEHGEHAGSPDAPAAGAALQ